ncbi:plexin A3-like [Mytilus edulis]|uniref:plexin A3-like n=1 Tax=Mytilus edulis TaxID=6550 RepID=UPI0039EF338B
MLLALIIQTTVVLTVTAQKNLTPNGTATQSSDNDAVKGKAENAINPPISNVYSIDDCSSTKLSPKGITEAWWMFIFSFDTAYITDVTIYYRENYAIRMDGFELYVTNTSTIPPDGYRCYEDPFSPNGPYPNITQTIPCNQLGKYVIYYDKFGSNEDGIPLPVVELCYVAIDGCPKSFWGSNCGIPCAESCTGQHCFPGNGSCILGGCTDDNCLNSNCDKTTAKCTDGCTRHRTGPFCNNHNIASNSSVLLHPNGDKQTSLVTDGNKTSCIKTQGSEIWVQVDIEEKSFVREIFLDLIENNSNGGNHTIYASNSSGIWENGTVLYRNETLPTVILVDVVFRYMIYVPPIQDENSSLEVCEVGIVGCPPANYGPLCNKMCPVYCTGPCDLENGTCTFGCLDGWSGDQCEIDAHCMVNSITLAKTCVPIVDKVYPSSGPVNGGTLVTITGKYLGNTTDNISLNISGVICHNVTVTIPNTELTCVIGKGNTNQTEGISVSVNSINYSNQTYKYFSFKKPMIIEVSPLKGIVFGGTTVTIRGEHIDFKGQDRYNISFCDEDFCIKCSLLENTIRSTNIKCKTGKSQEPRNMTLLHVVIDDLTILELRKTFQYLPDPTFNISSEPQTAQKSGGSTFTIQGEGFNNVGEVTVERVEKPCNVPDDYLAVCETPPQLGDQTNQTVIVHFDGLTVQIPLEYVNDPTFEKFKGVKEYDKESSIKIMGKNILNGARPTDYTIHIGLDGSCFITNITMQLITCFPPKSVPRTNKTDVNTVHVIVNVGNIKAYIGDLLYKEDVNTLAFVVGALAAALATAIIIGVSAVVILRKKKKKAIKEFKMELMTREEMIRKASREEFADAQMNIRDIKADLVTTRVPYSSYQNYILHQLFPNQDISNNPLLHDSEITDDRKAGIKSAIEKFEMLLSNKLFLKSLIQTLDRPNMLTMQEKAHFASVLSISLLGNMRLFFDLVQCLLVDMVRSSTKKQQKVLFRRFDSITMRLMVNWLQIGLYKHLTSRSGIHLFMLYRAVQTIIEMGPIDALTGNSKNTIAEEKLLKMRIEYQSLTLQIDLNGNSDQHYPVKVLDCDTISQVKQKCCAQIYKNKPASEIPHNDELSLEWQQGKAGKLLLNDIDNTSDRNNGLVCLNTLKHYMVQDDSKMALMYKQHDDDDVYVNSTEIRTESVTSEDITLLMPDKCGGEELETHKWHLVYLFLFIYNVYLVDNIKLNICVYVCLQ